MIAGQTLLWWYTAITVAALAVGFVEVFVGRNAEIHEMREAAPGWVSSKGVVVVAVLAVIVVAVLWPVQIVVWLYLRLRRVVCWAADLYLNWYTRRQLRKLLQDTEGQEGRWSHE